MCKLATGEISIFKLVCVAEQAGLKLALSETPKTGFLATRPILFGSRREKACLRGFPNQPAQCSATENSQKIEIWLAASLDMILSNKRITKALIRLHGCAGWSVSLLFPNLRRQVLSR